MALPTIHWYGLLGWLQPGARITVFHMLRDGQYPNGSMPNAVLRDMASFAYPEPPNLRIGEYQARTTQNLYLSNYDGTAVHYYGVIARRFHSINGQNL